ncbi:hypothetical protein HDV05_003058 [Chytridiales sp. JEL 0842]|nr:hypothetical protein HDV05_003058 [Chytridiales sp. JEL 0842]
MEEQVTALVRQILSKDLKTVESAIQRYYTEDATYQHPIFYILGKKEIIRMYLFWSKINTDFRNIRIHYVLQSPERLFLDVSYEFKWRWYPLWQSARVLILLTLKEKAEGEGNDQQHLLITKQEEFYQTNGLVGVAVPFPFTNSAAEIVYYLLRFTAILITTVVYFIVMLIF